jgi:peptidoglycan/LPS O-acetylase OafA/YrhL
MSLYPRPSQTVVAPAGARAPAPTPGKPFSLGYQPGIDGLRALCVLAILLYHAELPWLGGGFLGVEVFFVISGYLITSLLRSEFAGSQRIDLLDFWRRRARRLLPALWALLFAVSVYAVAYLPGELYRLRGEVVAGLTYVSNWYLLLGHHSYFEQVGRPSLLKHLWSLAIEEQFYLAWPLLFAALSRRGSARLVGAVSLVLAVSSAFWLAVRVEPGVDPSALYFDSSARAAAMLFGAVLACFWSPSLALDSPVSNAEKPRSSAYMLLDLLGGVGLAVLAYACSFWSEADALVFRGGLVLVDLAALAVIVAVVHPRGRFFKRLLGAEPLRFIGTRSYGLYLWHWPLFVLTRPGLDLPLEGAASLFVRLAGAFALAELSYRFIEEPVRSGRLTKLIRARAASREPGPAARLSPWVLGGAALSVVGCVFVTDGFVHATPPREPRWELTLPVATPQGAGLTGQVPLASDTALARASSGSGVSGTGGLLPGSSQGSVGPQVLIFGDSVVLGAKNFLRLGHETEVEFDSEIGRTSSTALPRLRKLKRTNKLRPVVIIHLGNNGWVYEEQIHEMMTLLADAERVVFVNAHVPKRWQDRNNAAIASAIASYPKAVLLDWFKASEGHREWFGADGLHLTPVGAQAFAALLSPFYATPSAGTAAAH